MTQLDMIYLASIVGAVLFFTAGAAAAALRRRPPAIDPAALLSHDAEIAARAAEIAELRAAVDARTTELATAHATCARTRAELAAAVSRPPPPPVVDHTALRAMTERAAAAEARVARLTAELERARGEATTAAGELATAQARVAELDRQLADRASAARDLSTENEQLKGRLRDAEGIRAEYVRLRTAATDAEFLKREVERLEGELRAMHVEALSPARPRQARGSIQPATSTRRTIGDSLATAIDRFADDGTRSIAVADQMGFPLASNGPDGVALAAYGSLLMEAASRSRQFLPVAAPAAIEIVDDHGTRLSVWTFEVDGDRLLLANLAVTPVDARRLETTLADLSAILAPTQLASYSR